MRPDEGVLASFERASWWPDRGHGLQLRTGALRATRRYYGKSVWCLCSLRFVSLAGVFVSPVAASVPRLLRALCGVL